MRSRLDGTLAALRSPYPWVALAAGLVFTAAGWVGAERTRLDEARVQFERRTETAVSAVRARMLAYEMVLRSGAARIASSPHVSREEWRSFIANLQLDERFPGIQSVGYAEALREATRAQHVSRMRADGFGDYEIHPPGVRPESVVVVYNEPFVGRNARLIGYDMVSDPVRTAAMDRARESGEAAVSGRVILMGDAQRGTQVQQPGFVMFVPVFQAVARDLPRHEQRNAVAGFVFSAFRMHDLMRGLLDEGVLGVLDMRVYDEADKGVQAQMLDTRTAWRPTVSEIPPLLERIVHFPMPARNWTIQFVSRPEFDRALRQERPWLVLGGGLLASVVVFLLTTALVEAWNRAHNLSLRDPLTGLYNRRYLDETMGREAPRARRSQQNISAIVLDIDHFRELNDRYGTDAGDHVLSEFGQMLRKITRSGDIPCRLGGEQFGVLLPGATLEVARDRAEAIRAAFHAMPIEFDGVRLPPATLSAGVAALSPREEDWSHVLRRADKALYRAKQTGRNRVVLAEE